jgi:hypothetical protein
MFVVTEAEAAAIRATFEQRGELAAAVELRRLFPGITDITQARECARTIAGWKPLTRGAAFGQAWAAASGPGALIPAPPSVPTQWTSRH